MTIQREAAREISYASAARTKSGRALIRMVENSTGRLSLIRRANGYAQDVSEGQDFWRVMTQRYGLSLDICRGSLEYIPTQGPLVVVANHPYGILDGLIIGHILSAARRGDFRVIAHRVFSTAPELENLILPISFDSTKSAVETNVSTRRAALQYLGQGGAIGIFPGGTVATAPRPFGQPMDPKWRSFTAKMIVKSGATVVPIFFDGQNSRLFQIASHMHSTLRMALLIKEFKKRIDTPVRLGIGQPVCPNRIADFADDPRKLMDFLRAQTYALSPKPLKTLEYGFEFEDKYKT
jgi:putative hemolysin